MALVANDQSPMTGRFCDVVVPKTRLDGLTYRYDQTELPGLAPGDCVQVCLRGKKRAGVVFGLRRRSPVARTLPLLALLERGFLPAETVGIVRWLAAYYYGRLGEALTLALPGGRLPIAGQTTTGEPELPAGVREPDPGFAVRVSLRPKFETVAAAVIKMRERGSVVVLAPETRLAEWKSAMAGEWGAAMVEFHGRQPARERRANWDRARRNRRVVVVGVRSAVLAPVSDLAGLIVVDEHRSEFKEERSPRFHARDVAVARGRLAGCPVLICDATPSAETWLNLKNGSYHRLEPDGAAGVERSAFVVDMRLHRGELISPRLERELRRTAEQGRSAVLYLNRRGLSRNVVCRDCGRALACRACGLPMLLTRQRILECSCCGVTEPAPEQCPGCSGSEFDFRSPGLDTVAETAGRRFPAIRVHRVLRGDSSDNKPGSFIVGTRALLSAAWPDDVALVAAVDADADLVLPDFRGRERTFQTLSRLLARAQKHSARAVVQTRRPDDPAIAAALTGDVAGFMDAELRLREELRFPPFCRLALVELRGPGATPSVAEKLARQLRRNRGVEVLGPTAGRAAGVRLLVKLPRETYLARALPPDALRLRGVRVRVDVDPLDVV